MWLDLCFKWWLWYYVKNRVWGQGQVWAVGRAWAEARRPSKDAAMVWVSNDGGWKHVVGVSRMWAKAKPSGYCLVSWRQSSFRGHIALSYTVSEPFICDLKTGIKTRDSEVAVGNKPDEEHPAESPTPLTLNKWCSWSAILKPKTH